MGCDIHMIVQRRDETGAWVHTDLDGFGGRHYLLFACLAGVRNNDNIVPFAEPRGLPPDLAIDQEYGVIGKPSRYGGNYNIGDHSFTWLGLDEILAFDWERPTTRTGFVSEAEFRVFLEKGQPDSWCGGVGGRTVEVVLSTEMRRLAVGGGFRMPGMTYYCEVSWTKSLREQIGPYWFAFLDKCRALDPDPKNVRLVFGFDS